MGVRRRFKGVDFIFFWCLLGIVVIFILREGLSRVYILDVM